MPFLKVKSICTENGACIIAEQYGDSNILAILHQLNKDKNGHVRWYANIAINELRNSNN